MLIREDRGVQRLVYYTGRALQGLEARYPQIEKLAFASVTSVVELGGFDIEYLPRTAIKGQRMANFLVEFTNFTD